MQTALFALAIAAITSCGSSSKQLSLEDYDRTCTTVLDCTAVFFDGTSCCQASCPNATIRASELPRFKHDLMSQSCAQTTPCTRPSMCADGRVQCVEGMCVILRPDAGN